MLNLRGDVPDDHLRSALRRLAEKYPDRRLPWRHLFIADVLFRASDLCLRARLLRLAEGLDATAFRILVLGASRDE